MKNILIGIFIGCIIAIICFAFANAFVWFVKAGTLSAITSSPVEEMYHRQLVVTLDSVLDARLGAGCCEEDIDTINTNIFRTHFGDNLLPLD